jgi:hypothetical protein
MRHLYWLLPTLAVFGVAVFCWFLSRRVSPQAMLAHGRYRFQQERMRLELLFFQAASVSGKPRGLRWRECQWSDLIEWVRDKQTGQMLAFVGVTISFEAIEGGDMEGIEAVGNLRNASAVFHFQDGQWQTSGRAIFNLNPDEALEHFKNGYERMD